MKIKQSNVTRNQSSKPTQLASKGTNIPEDYNSHKAIKQISYNPKSLINESSALPQSTTRALDPDYHFHHGFLIDNPVNRQESERSFYSQYENQIKNAVETESMKDFWNFKGSQVNQNKILQSFSNHDNQPGSNGSINNIKKVFQKAQSKRSSSHEERATINRDHKLVRGMHRHSDDNLASDLVDKTKQRPISGTKSYASARQHSIYNQVRRMPNTRKIATHIENGIFCQSCLFENESCIDCLRSNGYAHKELPKRPFTSKTSYTPKLQAKPAHLNQGNFCETCLFSEHACDNCLAVEQKWNRESSRFASKLNEMEKNRNHKQMQSMKKGSPAHIMNGIFCETCLFDNEPCESCNPSKFKNNSTKINKGTRKLPDSPFAITWKRATAMPFHLSSGNFCATCLFENSQCIDCFRSNIVQESNKNQQRVTDKNQMKMRGPNEENWRRPQVNMQQSSSWKNGQWSQNMSSYSTNGAFGIQKQSQWKPSNASLSTRKQNEMIEIDWVNVIPKGYTSNAAGSTNGSITKQSRDERSGSARDRPQITKTEHFDEDFEADHSGAMRPNKTYIGRTKQTHCDTKRKRPKHYF